MSNYGKRMVPEPLLKRLEELNSIELQAKLIAGSNITITDNTISAADTLMENIKDSDGNLRFVEGNISTNTITGVTFTYNKWSLSGTHLMLVLAGTIAANTTIANGTVFAQVELPNYIQNKIVPIITIGNRRRFSRSDYKIFDNEYGTVDSYNVLTRDSSSGPINFTNGAVTNEKLSGFRIQFDFLIDNE